MLFQVKVNETRENNKTFLLKLYEILEVSFAVNRLKNIKVLSIGQDLQSFTEKILPKYFKHDKFSSFVRQLNNYDFHKVKNSDFEYFNEKFSKFHKETISSILRKPKAKEIEEIEDYSVESLMNKDYSKLSKKTTEKIIRFLINNIENLNKIIMNLELKIESLNKMKDDLTWQNQYIMQEMVKKNDSKRIETLLYFLMEFIFPHQKNMSEFFKNFNISNCKNHLLPSPETEFNLKNNNLDEFPIKYSEKAHLILNEFQTNKKVVEYNYPMLAQSEELIDKLSYNQDFCSIAYKVEELKKEEVKHFSIENNYNLSDFDRHSMNLAKSPIFELPLSFNDSDKNTGSPKGEKLKFTGRKLKRKDSIFSSHSLVNGKTFSENIFSIMEDD